MRKRILFKDEEISREIERRIEAERLNEGARLPSERELAEDFGVQRDTIRCALEILLKKGVLVKKPRQGYYVALRRIEFDLNNFRSVKKSIEKVGRESKAVLLTFEKLSMSEKLSEKTLLPEGTLCYVQAAGKNSRGYTFLSTSYNRSRTGMLCLRNGTDHADPGPAGQ